MTTTTYQVAGMTCGHCVSAVTAGLEQLDAVTDVEVALETGAVTVASTTPIDLDDVRAAIEGAGYELSP